jgi:hypothetical protein
MPGLFADPDNIYPPGVVLPPPPGSLTRISIDWSATQASAATGVGSDNWGTINVGSAGGVPNPSGTVLSITGPNTNVIRLSSTTPPAQLLLPSGGLAAGDYNVAGGLTGAGDVTITATKSGSGSVSISPKLTVGRTTIQVNGRITAPTVYTGDNFEIGVRGIPAGASVATALVAVPPGASLHSTSAKTPGIASMRVKCRLATGASVNPTIFAPGTYRVLVSVNGGANISFDFTAIDPPQRPFRPLPGLGSDVGVWNPFIFRPLNFTGGIDVRGGSNVTCHGTITTDGIWEISGSVANLYGQFLLDGQPIPGHGPQFDASGFPVMTLDTIASGIPDGAHTLTYRALDVPAATGWCAGQLRSLPFQIIVVNNPPPSIAGTYAVKVPYLPQHNRPHSELPDTLQYVGLPVAAASEPYPGGGNAFPLIPPATDPASPWHANPALGRVYGNWWCGSPAGLIAREYQNKLYWATSTTDNATPRGVFAQSWTGKAAGGANALEPAYATAKLVSTRDGTTRNTAQVTAFATFIATPAGGPFSAVDANGTIIRHWTGVQLNGKVCTYDLHGALLTIAGLTADEAQLPFDWSQSSPVLAEAPNARQVGTIDTAALYALDEIAGGGVNDLSWDPRDPGWILYITRPVDHVIVKINFHTQTIGGVAYGPSNPLVQRYAGYESGVAGDGNGGFVDAVALSTGSGGAQFAGPYSICQVPASGMPVGYPYPAGTMFVADSYSGLIRVISAGALDTNGNQATPSTVSTLVGLHGGTTPRPPAFATTPLAFYTTATALLGTFNVATITFSGPSSGLVTMAAATPITSVGWYVTVLQNGSPWSTTVSGDDLNSGNGRYKVSSWSSSTSFTLIMPSVPTTGTITINVYAMDSFSAPVETPFAGAYTIYPAFLRLTSGGDVVYADNFYNGCLRRIWLTAGAHPANTITRLANFGGNNIPSGDVNGGGFTFLDVDTVGACGPQDLIFWAVADTVPGAAADGYSILADGTGFQKFGTDGPGPYPNDGPPAIGHYPWAFAFSKTRALFIGAGESDTALMVGRTKMPSDPDPTAIDAVFGNDLFNINEPLGSPWTNGTIPAAFPLNIRPPFSAIHGFAGGHLFGANTAPQIDDLPGLYPTDATLLAFLQSGLGGGTPRPEFGADDYGMPGYWTRLMLYWINRQALRGSWPAQYPPCFDHDDGDKCGVLATFGLGGGQPVSADFVRPVVTVQSGDPVRVSATSVRMRFTTDKPSLAIVVAGTPNSAGARYPYVVWSPLQSAYGTNFDITLTGIPSNALYTPTHLAALAVDQSNNAHCTADFTVS